MALLNVIKYEGGPNIFAWKYPNSELTTATQLIVNESQEAIFFKGGQALDIFGPGRHTLETKNIPILSKLINIPFGGRSPFSAEIWYVNKINSLDIKWGTPTPIPLFDPFLMVDVKVRSFGQFGIRIENSKKFLEKLVGTLAIFNAENIVSYFKGEYLKRCTAMISSYFTQKNIGILQINTHLESLSDYIKDKMDDVMNDYGISLLSFSVNSITADENDSSYQYVKEAMANSAKTRWEETAKTDTKAYEQHSLGYTYQQQRSYDVMEQAASNESGMQNQFMDMGMGLAMGNKMGAVIGTQMGDIAAVMNVTPDITSDSTKVCPKCNFPVNENQKFCGNCGAAIQTANSVTCIHCGASIGNNIKFCTECGKPQQIRCEKCNAEIQGSTKFCPECGNRLRDGEQYEK